jgi:hypothetical protein
MTQPPQALPSGGHKREEMALDEIEHTRVSAGTARLLLAAFLAALAVVPIAELVVVRSPGVDGIETAWSQLTTVPDNIRSHLIQELSSNVWSRVVAANRILLEGLTRFERALENESLIGRILRPPAQLVMTERLGAGNERVYRGHAGWLFYRPDVEYITGRGFLEPAQLERRVDSTPQWTAPPQPDPRTAIVQFARDLDRRGIALVVVPTPPKSAIHPEMLADAYSGTRTVPENPSFDLFLQGLRRDNVLVFDPTETLAAGRPSAPQYLQTDTHWRPEAMEAVAEMVAAFITAQVTLPSLAVDPTYRVERLEMQNQGDLSRMLDLPDGAAAYPPETVWLRRVLEPDGAAWRPSRTADVLLLGDSFVNIYALESMGWGTSSGFAEQLSRALARPIDRIVQNDEGAFATRAMLARDPSRLAGKRIVVYQFAARELALGDWKVIPLP